MIAIYKIVPHPFTVLKGEITCSFHPTFGREVYFAPYGYIGTPLNKSAVDSLILMKLYKSG